MTHLSLAEAIRVGAKTTRQTRNELYRTRYGVVGFTCAIGAAAHAVCTEQIDPNAYGYRVEEVFPELNTIRNECPACRLNDSLYFLIVHLNDDHRWTREAIADFVDGLTVEMPVAVLQKATS